MLKLALPLTLAMTLTAGCSTAKSRARAELKRSYLVDYDDHQAWTAQLERGDAHAVELFLTAHGGEFPECWDDHCYPGQRELDLKAATSRDNAAIVEAMLNVWSPSSETLGQALEAAARLQGSNQAEYEYIRGRCRYETLQVLQKHGAKVPEEYPGRVDGWVYYFCPDALQSLLKAQPELTAPILDSLAKQFASDLDRSSGTNRLWGEPGLQDRAARVLAMAKFEGRKVCEDGSSRACHAVQELETMEAKFLITENAEMRKALAGPATGTPVAPSVESH